MGYTYDDFVSAANSAGMLEKFDKMDLEIAKKNPEFGLSLLSLKKDAAAATTDEQRLLATEAANQLRKNYGNYSIENGTTEYAGSFGQQITDTMDQLKNYGDYTYGNEDAYQKLLEAVANQKEFSYDPETDPVYSAYKKAFLREGERATAQALAQASAATGGRPSSYAVTAAAQAGNNYAGRLSDVIPTLFQGAYDRHNADFSTKLSSLSALSGDRQFDYGKWLDGYNRLQGMLGNLQTQDNTEYGRYLDAWNMAQQLKQEDFEKQLAAAELMASKKDYTLLGQLYGLTQEQIDVLNGKKKKTSGSTKTGGDKLDGSGVDANTIINMQYSLGVEPTGVWDAETAKAAGTKSAKEAKDAWNSGTIGKSVNQKIQQANKEVQSFAPKSNDAESLTKQIEKYAAAITDRDVGKEVGAALLVKYGLV